MLSPAFPKLNFHRPNGRRGPLGSVELVDLLGLVSGRDLSCHGIAYWTVQLFNGHFENLKQLGRPRDADVWAQPGPVATSDKWWCLLRAPLPGRGDVFPGLRNQPSPSSFGPLRFFF